MLSSIVIGYRDGAFVISDPAGEVLSRGASVEEALAAIRDQIVERDDEGDKPGSTDARRVRQRVAELHRAGFTTAQIARRLSLIPRHVRRIKARFRDLPDAHSDGHSELD
jgi:DNA-binding NarL/FixJ family response regulator